jgi:hypothetical protein
MRPVSIKQRAERCAPMEKKCVFTVFHLPLALIICCRDKSVIKYHTAQGKKSVLFIFH